MSGHEIRICATGPAQAELKQTHDGRYFVKGATGESLTEMFDIIYNLYKNISFDLSTLSGCLDRIKNNQSDFSIVFSPFYEDEGEYYSIPVPLMVSRVEFMTGYSMTSDHLTPKECGTVMDNATLLEPSVYLGSLGLCLSFILVIFFRALVRAHHKRAKKETYYSHLYFWTSTVKRTLVEVKELINGSGSNRLISLFYSVLLFYLITCFCSLYKTSQIIVEEPYVVRSYEDIIKDNLSYPVFLDTVNKMSHKFLTAPKESLRGKVLSKIEKRGRKIKDLILGNGEERVPAMMQKAFEVTKLVDSENVAFFGTSMTINLIKTLYCASSEYSEGKFRRAFVISDASKHEQLVGFPLSANYSKPKEFSRKMRLLFESQILPGFFTWAMDCTRFTYSYTGASQSHQFKQNWICSSDFSYEKDLDVKGIPSMYFDSFFHLIVAIFTIALVLFILEFSTQGQRPLCLPFACLFGSR